MARNVDVVMPFNLVMRIKNIPEDEIEDYVNDIQMALSSMFYSTDADDDHFEVKMCHPEWHRSYKEDTYED